MKWFLPALAALSVTSCLPVVGQGGGTCKTSSGEVNTHRIAGTGWKLDDPTNTEASFDVIFFEPASIVFNKPPEEDIDGIPVVLNSIFCTGRYNNSSTQSPGFAFAKWIGAYDNNVTDNQVGIQFADLTTGASLSNPDSLDSQWVRYDFGGSCDGTKLTLTFPGDVVKTYTLYNHSVGIGVCTPQ